MRCTVAGDRDGAALFGGERPQVLMGLVIASATGHFMPLAELDDDSVSIGQVIGFVEVRRSRVPVSSLFAGRIEMLRLAGERVREGAPVAWVQR